MSHSQNPLLKTLDKQRLESSKAAGEPLSHAGDAETYLPVGGAKGAAQLPRSTSGIGGCRGGGQPGSSTGRGRVWGLALFADGPAGLWVASAVPHSTWEPAVGMFLLSAVWMLLSDPER